MKKLFYSFTMMALAALLFNSCEDVPAPFGLPNSGGDTPTPTVEPAGSGTAADPYNVAAVIAYAQTLEIGQESPSNIYIKGKIASIKEEYTTQYGNATFTISDDGTAKNTFTIYRALYLNNKKFSANDTQIQVGDEVVVCGIVTNYNGTLETQQNKAYLYSLNGEGGGGGGGGQTGEAKGSGTQADPWNPAGAIQYINTLAADAESDKDYYIKGKISEIREEFTTQYGNASFYISEDGTNSGTFYVFRTLYLNNKKFAAGDTQIKVGDEVVICGRLVNYRGNTPETVQNKSYIYSLNGSGGGGGGGGQTGDAKGSGTLSDPWNAVAANNYTNSLAADTESDKDYYIKGIIAKIANNGEFSDQYGNASFYISDDGKDENTFYVFRTLYLGNQKWTSGNSQVKVGDEVIICGRLVNYRGNTPETVQNKSYIYSLNGKTEGGGGGGGGETGEVKSVSIADFNAAAESNDVWYQLKGTVKNLKDGDQFGNFDLEDNTGSVYVYGLLSEKGGEKKKFQELAAAKGIKNGSIITIIGNRGSYNGKIEVLNAYLVSVDGESGGGGGGGDTGSGGSYKNPFTVTQAIAAGSGTGVYVKGFIVGYVDGQAYETGAHFDASGEVKTNILIAASASETDVTKCMPVQLPSGAVRNGVNLADNRDLLYKEVLLYGNIEVYFKVPGVKSVTYAEVDGKNFGTKASVKRRR